MATTSKPKTKKARKTASRDGARTARRLLEAATAEFSRRGYEGARIERIIAKAGCNMRMLYHYYGSKQKLYLAVLERIYADIREKEQQLALDHLAPLEGITALVDFTYSHFAENKDFVQITLNENVERGVHLARLHSVQEKSSPLLAQITTLLKRGRDDGVFRDGVDALQLYVSIVALSCHHINNVYTLSLTFGTDLGSESWRKERRGHVRQMILSYLTDMRSV
ncbi:MAG: TetR family transcriptional regulator [Rhodopseudomonas sp.]|nr:TetR family transcriptional regulator [Rhodopseudomonas sp.]